MDLPVPKRDADGNLVGYEMKKTDLIKLLKRIPNYSPFRDAKGFYFSTDEAEIIRDFIRYECVFPEGKLTGKPFIPELWQWAIYLNMYCWFTGDPKKPRTPHLQDYRRYNEVLVYVPRKNGKTTAFGAVPALISVYVDPENRSQNFCCAADVEQANNTFRHASYMVENNPRLLNMLTKGRVRHSQRYLEHNNGRTFKVLSSIADTKHGLSPNCVIVDEVHAHPNSELIDVMITGTGARENPLTIYTTTADYNRPSTCNELHKRGTAICRGTQKDPHFLPVIYEADVKDDWEDPATWRKANPNFGISLTERYLMKEIERCRNNPAMLGRLLRLHLNIKTSVETAWIPLHVWTKTNPGYKDTLTVSQIRDRMEEFPEWFNVVKSDRWTHSDVNVLLEQHRQYYTWLFDKVDRLKDERCIGAFDNSSVSDIASFTLFFPESGTVLQLNWVPAQRIKQRSEEDGVPYDDWFACGLVNETEHETIDEEEIVNALVGDTGLLNHFEGIEMVAFDAWRSNFVANKLGDYGIECGAYSQSFSAMHPCCKKVEELLDHQALFHGGYKPAEWMLGNTMVIKDAFDRVRPSRKDSTDKIDGIVSILMSVGAWLTIEDNTIQELSLET